MLTVQFRGGCASPLAVILTTSVTPISWGTTYLVTTEMLPPGRPLTAGVMRAVPAGLVLLALGRRMPPRDWWPRLLVLSALYIGVFFPLLFLAAYRLPGGVAAVVGSAGPLLVLGLARVLLGERATAARIVAGVTAVLGVGLIAARAGGALDVLGLLAALAGTVSMATATVLAKRWGRPESLGRVAFTGWQLLLGGLMVVPLAAVVEGLPPVPSTANVVGAGYLALVNTAAAYLLWFRGLDRLAAGTMAFLPLLSPVTATVLGWLVLDQSLGPAQLLGLVLALGASAVGSAWAGRGPRSSSVRTGGETVYHLRPRGWPRRPRGATVSSARR